MDKVKNGLKFKFSPTVGFQNTDNLFLKNKRPLSFVERNNRLKVKDYIFLGLALVTFAGAVAALTLVIVGSTKDQASGHSAHCQSAPCDNNGTCVDVADNYICTCVATYFGRNCEISKESQFVQESCFTFKECVDIDSGEEFLWLF